MKTLWGCFVVVITLLTVYAAWAAISELEYRIIALEKILKTYTSSAPAK